MIQDIISYFFSSPVEFNPSRKFPHPYFLNEAFQKAINTKGYVLIKNAINEESLNFLSETYQKLTTFPEYSINDKFQNSGRYRSPEIRSYVMDRIGKFSKEYLPTIFNPEVYDENTTGAFQIKPPSKVSELNPHQDAPVIDETVDNGLFVWIPFCDITDKNGAVCVLPGSHLWGNCQRSLNVKWVFEKQTKTLWKHMKPIYMNKGDILVWDTALIHASHPNLTHETRVAITTTLLPKDFKMVEYFKDAQTPAGKVEKYRVERSFWESEDIMKRPPCPPNQFLGYEENAFPEKISGWNLRKLIQQTNEYLK